MSNHPPAPPKSAGAALRQFFRKPKGLLILVFAAMLAVYWLMVNKPALWTQ